MKVLHVTEAYGGGVLAVLNQLANGLASKNVDVGMALSVRSEAPVDWISQIDSRVEVCEISLTREINPLKDFRALIKLIRLFKAEAPDAIHLHSSKAGFVGRVAARLTGYSSRTFYSPHAFAYLAPHLSPLRRSLYRWLEKIGALFGGTVIACSSDELDEARKLGVRAVAVNNAVDLRFLDRVAGSVSRRKDGVIRVVTAGRVCAAKRPEFFVAVAEAVRKQHLPCEFVWIGGGDTPPETDAVSFTGWKPRGEALTYMRSHGDIYVQTSTYEGLPVAVLEAQALGLPAVVTDAVGNRSAIANGITGYVSSLDSVPEFVEKLRILIDRAELRSEFGHAARQRIESEFDVPLMLENYLKNYQAGAAPC